MARLLASLMLPFVFLLLATTTVVRAQDVPPSGVEGGIGDAPFNLPGDGDQFGGFPGLPGGGPAELTLEGELRVTEASRDGVLRITATLATGWHTYAVDQQGGPGPTKFTVGPEAVLQLQGPFRPDHAPEVRELDYFDVPLREHYGRVSWTAPVRLAEGVDPETAALQVKFDGQICNDSQGCKPIFGQQVEVKFGGYDKPAAPIGEYRAARSHATLRGHVQPATAQPGGSIQLVISAECDSGWHVYAYAETDPDQVAKPTLIAINTPPGWSQRAASASRRPVSKFLIPGDPPVSYYEGPVTWTVPLQVPEDAQPGTYELSGVIGYQTCTDRSCDPPAGANFRVSVVVGEAQVVGEQPLELTAARYGEAAALAAKNATQQPLVVTDSTSENVDDSSPDASPAPAEAAASGAVADGLELENLDLSANAQPQRSIALILGIAFLGGFILNFMPCVLPVIGLKIMSFVQQAGESRGKVFSLNVWYAAGLVSVFLVLATLAAVWNLGWGEQFNFDKFNITMVAVIFIMGLSFLGVWEIPIPGFMGTGKANEMAEKEGPAGAFLKGVITTILATPCSGPGLATALAWCNGKPVPLVYMVFAVMGLGMASPYLVIGANPGLARYIPKPGEWMETFKQVMGFVLLGTVVYMLTFIHWSNVVPTIAFLFGLWMACWWVGRIPIYADFQQKVRGWLAATAFAVLMGLFAFGDRIAVGGTTAYGLRGMMDYRLTTFVDKRAQDQLMAYEQSVASAETAAPAPHAESDSELPWQPFSEQRLKELTAENKTVLVDFTADWCLTCKFLERTVLNTRDVREVVDKNGVVPLVADWTDRGEEISRWLSALGSKQVPVIAIFPAGKANQPIVLMGGYRKSTLISKLEEAGPSQAVAQHEDMDGPAAEVASDPG